MMYYQLDDRARYLNPSDITIERGYTIEVFAEQLDAPSSILFTDSGDLLIVNSGYTSGNPSVSILNNGVFEVIADDFNFPLLGINYYEGLLYVSHRGVISTLTMDGNKQNILIGLPSYGDYSNCRVDFSSDGKLYFGVGTATNSGVVGADNLWVPQYSFFYDKPGAPIILNGQNFITKNILMSRDKEMISTGAFCPFGETNNPHEMRKAVIKAAGSILKMNIDGSGLELVAWGLRCPSYLKFYEDKLFVTNNGYDTRGSRPIANASDEFLLISEGSWYGFPDYSGSEPVTLPRFKPESSVQPEFLLACHPSIPAKPFSLFPPDSFLSGFDFNKDKSFGNIGDIYIAEFGSIQLSTISGLQQMFPTSGYKVSKINHSTGTISTFAMNKSGFPSYITREGGFGRPVDIAFGQDGAMYIVDMGINNRDNPNMILPNTGVIWRVTKDL